MYLGMRARAAALFLNLRPGFFRKPQGGAAGSASARTRARIQSRFISAGLPGARVSGVEVLADVDNAFLMRRELTCSFAGAGDALRKLDAARLVSEKLGLAGKTVVPVSMGTQVGMPSRTGTFYVYDDEKLAYKQVDPSVMARLDRARKAEAEKAQAEQAPEAKDEQAPAEAKAEGAPAEAGSEDRSPAEAAEKGE